MGKQYEIEPENGGRQFAIYTHDKQSRRQFVARYLKKENAERHIARLKEKWG